MTNLLDRNLTVNSHNLVISNYLKLIIPLKGNMKTRFFVPSFVWGFIVFVFHANAVAIAMVPIPAPAISIWFATEDTLSRLTNDSNQIATSLPLSDINALSVNAKDGSLLALTEKRIFKFSPDGVKRWEKSLADIGLEEGRHLALNPYDNSLWVSSNSLLVQLNAEGQKLNELSSVGGLQLFTIALDESLWLYSKSQIRHYTSKGTLLSNDNISNLFGDKAKQLVVDSLGNRLWIAGKDQLAQFNLADMGKSPVVITLPVPIEKMVVDPLTGMLWMVGKTRLLAYTNNAALVMNINLASLGIEKPESIAYDSQKKNLWLGHKNGIAKISREGALLANTHIDNKVKTIGVPAFFITPKLSVVQPTEAAVINNAQPTFLLDLSPLCFNLPCGLVPGYYGNYQVIANLNDKPVGNLFHIDTTTGWGSYTPSNALPEGSNTFNVQTRDRFGHETKVINTTFTIDAAPLKILDVSPTEGSVLNGSQVIVSGRFRGPANTGITVNNIIAAINDDKFYANVPLQAGANTITVIAKTPEGKTAQQIINVTNPSLAAIRINPNPAEGIAPLKVTFSFERTSEKNVQYISGDFDRDYIEDQVINSPNLNMEYTYSTPGVYYPRFIVRDFQGNAEVTEITVVVNDQIAMDKHFKSIWEGMNSALVAQNKSKALAYLNTSAKMKYEPIFSALLPAFPAIVASYSALQNVSTSSDLGEYAVNRLIDGKDQIFFIYFQRDSDGVWRLHSM